MKQFKNCKVIMLPASRLTNVLIALGSRLFYIGNREYWKNKESYGSWKHQHLYFISNDDIKEGDLFLADERLHVLKGEPDYSVVKCHSIINEWIESNDRIGEGFNPTHSKKIIATTDTSLSLPLIPSSFIEAYCKVNGKLDEIQIVLNDLNEWKTDHKGEPYANFNEIKLRSNSTCIVHTAKSYSREKLCSCLQYYYEYIINKGYIVPAEWLDKHEHF